jgi:hypothetical protein
MKKTLFTITSLLLINAHAQDITGYCTPTVEEVVQSVYKASYPDSQITALATRVTGYSGYHQKAYVTELQTDVGSIGYKTLVFEYESEGTPCEIDALSKN